MFDAQERAARRFGIFGKCAYAWITFAFFLVSFAPAIATRHEPSEFADRQRTAKSALIIEHDILIAWPVSELVESPGSISATGFDILERIDRNDGIPTIIYAGIDKPADDNQLKSAVSRAASAGATRSAAEGPVQRQPSFQL